MKNGPDKARKSDSGLLTASPYLLVLIAVLLWSTGGVFIKITSIDAFAVNLGRSFFAATTVAIFLWYRWALRFDLFSLFAGLFYALTLSLFVYANKNTTAANAIFLQYTAPVYILVFAPFVLKERFRPFDLVTVIVCLTGMSLFFFDAEGSADAPNNLAGIIAGLVSGACLGLYFVLLRHPRALKHDASLSVLTGNLIIVVFMIPFVIQSGEGAGTLDLIAVAYLGIIQIGIAYILFTYGVANGVRPLDASIIGFVEPLLNPVWVVLFVGEKPSVWTIGGGGIILSAVLFHTIRAGYSLRRNDRSQTL